LRLDAAGQRFSGWLQAGGADITGFGRLDGPRARGPVDSYTPLYVLVDDVVPAATLQYKLH